MTQDEKVQLTMTGKLGYSATISLSQAVQVLNFITAPTSGAVGGELAPPPVQPLGGPSGSQTPREALEKSGASVNSEKIVALALYFMQEHGKDIFTLDDVSPLFRQAREAIPAKLKRDLDNAIKAGWIAESNTNGEFYVTEKASKVLETGFDQIRMGKSTSASPRVSSRKPRAAKPKRSTTSSAVPDAFAQIDEIAPVIDGYGNYHRLASTKDRFLWAVNAAKILGVPAVTNQELAWLTDKLGHGIPGASISTYFQRNHKAGYVNRSTQDNKIRIVPQGEEHLRSLVKDGNK